MCLFLCTFASGKVLFEMVRKKIKTGSASPYVDLFGVKNMGRGRPALSGVHMGRKLPFIEGASLEVKRKAMGRAMKVLKYTFWNELVAIYEAEVRYLVSEQDQTKENDSDG